MLVNLYESKTPIAVFSLPLLIALLAGTIFIVEPTTSNFPFQWQIQLTDNVQNINWLNYLLTVVISATTAHQLNNVYNQNSFFSKASFLPGFIYICCLVSFNSLSFTPSLVAHLFFAWGLGQFMKLRRQEQAKAIIFQGSLLFGLAFVCSPLQIGLIILPWLALTIFRPFVWREWFMVIGGLMIPTFYYLSATYMLDGEFMVFTKGSADLNGFSNWHLLTWINYSVLGLIVLGSFAKYLGVARTEINRFKLQSQLLYHFFWLGLVAMFLGWYFYDIQLLGVILPLSIIIATQLLHNKNLKVVNGIVIIWLIISVSNVILVG